MAEKVLEEIMAENSPNLEKDISQKIQKGKQTQTGYIKKKSIPRHICHTSEN